MGNLEVLVDLLRDGKVILHPTDTIWGLACDAHNIKAVERLTSIKERLPGKSYIVLVNSYDMLQEYITYIPPKARNLIDYFERPITIIYQQPKNLVSNILADDGSIAIRVVKDEYCRLLIQKLGHPIVSSSANLSGHPFPVRYEDIDDALIQRVDGVSDVRIDFEGMNPSMIVKVVDNQELEIIRK